MKFFLLVLIFSTTFFAKADTYQLFEEKGKVGMKNEQGVVIIPAAFESLGWSDGSFSVIGQTTGYRLNKHWGLINLKKEFVTAAEYEELTYKGGEYVVARKKLNPVSTKTGCINLRGEVKIPFGYDGIEISGLRAIVFTLAGAKFNYGLADLQNQILIPLSYKTIFSLGTLRYAVENREGKFALFSDDGKPITDFKIDSLSKFYKGYSIVYENGLQGLINREGKIKLPIQYQAIKIDEEGIVFAKLPGEWIYLNNKNEIQKKFFADDLIPVSNKRQIVRAGTKYGLLDAESKWLIPVVWDSLTEINENLFLVRAKNKWGAITDKNQKIISVAFDSIDFENGFRVFLKRNGWQLIDIAGKSLTQKSYQSIIKFNGASWIAQNGIYWGVLDVTGREIVHCVFDSIGDRTKNLVAVKFKGQYGIIDKNENWKLAPQLFPIRLANDSRYLLMQRGNSFLKNLNGDIIYFSSYPIEFRENYWIERLPNGNENKISYDGLKIIEETFSIPTQKFTAKGKVSFSFNEGLRGIYKDDKYGFEDVHGNLRVANRYDSIGDFHEGLAPVKLIGNWGFINASDKIVIHPNYQHVSFFQNGLAIASRNNKTGLIDKSGSRVLDFKYDTVKKLSNQKFEIVSSTLKGRVDDKGRIEIEPRFEFLQETVQGFLMAIQNGKWGLISEQGLGIIPLIYERLVWDGEEKQYLAWKKSEWKKMSIE